MLFLKELGFPENALRGLMAWLCRIIYNLISSLFDLFINISKVKILGDKQIEPIYQRITIILAIIMVFYVTFEFVKFVIQPDGIGDKEKGVGNIITKMVLVVILIAFVPTIFTYAYKFQSAIIENQILSKIILGKQDISSGSYGREFSADLLSAFYFVDEEMWPTDVKCEKISCKNIVNKNINSLRNDGRLGSLARGINSAEEKEGELIPYITFEGLIAAIVGVCILYVLVLFCIDIGTRVAQLAFLQIIAPIPIIGYLAPKKDNIFNKWTKQCITTYLDLFIRLALIYFVLLICEILGKAWNNGTLFNNIESNPGFFDMETLIYIALVMGLLLFAQKAPKMLGELFPKMGAASGNFGLKAGERVAPAAARAIGTGLGGVRVGVRGAIVRSRNRHIRNRENGAESVFTENGRRQRRERRNHQQESHDRDAEYAAAKRMNKAKEKVNIAKKELEEAKNTGNNEKIKAAQDKLDKANAEYYRASQSRNNSKEYQRRKQEAINAARDKNAAEQELAAAQASGDQRRIEAAKKRIEDNKKAMDAYGEFVRNTSDVDSAMIRARDARSQVATDQNKKYRSVALAGLSGLTAGTYRGAKAGMSATKLEDIGKKINEGVKSDTASIEAYEKWMDSGGGSNIDRVKTSIEKSMGITTEAGIIERQIKGLDDQIKANESLATLESDTKSKRDDVENRLTSKIEAGELKNEVKFTTGPNGERKIKGINEALDIRDNDTVSTLYGRYKAKADSAQSRLDALIKNGATQTEIRNAEEEASKARAMETAVKKHAMRNAYTQMLNDPNNSNNDQAALEKLATMQTTIANARSNEKITNEFMSATDKIKNNKIRAIQSDTTLTETQKTAAIAAITKKYDDQKTAFITGKYEDYEQLDDIILILQNNANERQRKNMGLKESKRKIETSDVYAAAKANDAASGKK